MVTCYLFVQQHLSKINLSFAQHPKTKMLLFHLTFGYSIRLKHGKQILKGFLYKLVPKFDGI